MSRKTIVVCDLCGANLPDDNKHYGRFYCDKPHVEAADLCPACAEYLAGAVQARKTVAAEALRDDLLAAKVSVCALCGEVEDHRNHMDGTDGPDDGHEFRTSLAGDANDE